MAKALVAAAMGLSLAVTPALTATAATNTPYVTKTEFARVKSGMTRTAISDLFGTGGQTRKHDGRSIWKQYRIAYGDKDYAVDVFYAKDRGGVFRVESWVAVWTHWANQSQNPATKSEFSKIKRGQSVDKVRDIIGSAGSLSFDTHYNFGDGLLHGKSYLWPVPDNPSKTYIGYGDVYVEFDRNSDGAYVVTHKDANW
ncbi:hypothetical protein [Microbacterium terricola]|uniref:Uncharacterized protein n=1 Tax=Microbacterium terricola TaxID=344163 RepID=A0ABM8DXD7_9MICO|nr:hypothetical protein [Microbacterium terricola]UYK38970.1 hypothetical protein OAU46_09640 [Microbacterium terricola]BDV30328.1 hypothetical protein Microterr_09880 [Microbacterium terricola]